MAVLLALGAWYDARTKPDPRTEAVASLAVTGAETDLHMAARLDSLSTENRAIRRRLARLERGDRALPRSDYKGTERQDASPAPAQRGVVGWLSRFLGNRDR